MFQLASTNLFWSDIVALSFTLKIIHVTIYDYTFDFLRTVDYYNISLIKIAFHMKITI